MFYMFLKIDKSGVYIFLTNHPPHLKKKFPSEGFLGFYSLSGRNIWFLLELEKSSRNYVRWIEVTNPFCFQNVGEKKSLSRSVSREPSDTKQANLWWVNIGNIQISFLVRLFILRFHGVDLLIVNEWDFCKTFGVFFLKVTN